MKVNFNFDTGARRIRLRPEDVLEETVLKEMALLCEKGVNMKICCLNNGSECDTDSYEIEIRINGFDKEKKSE